MTVRRWMPFLLLASATWLSGCASAGSERLTAPPVLDYSSEVQTHAVAEMAILGPPCPRDAVFGGCSAVKRFVLDYAWMRDKVRAIQE